MEVEMRANAKINLALDVLADRQDGYHEVDMVIQEIALADQLCIENGRGGFVLTCDDPDLALDQKNTIYQAWLALKDRAEDPSVVVELEKRIPKEAGLGGGSSDGAAMLKGLNKLWELDLTDEELEAIGAQIGSDVPFFIKGGTQRAQGRGEKLTLLRSWHGRHLVLVNPGLGLSTAYVYAQVKANGTIPVDRLVHAINASTDRGLDHMANQLETVALRLQPKLHQIKKELIDLGAQKALVSGSGPTVFGLFADREEALHAEKILKSAYPFVCVSQTV